MEAFRPRHHDLANPFDLAAFKAELLGEVILPGQSDYDRARQIHDLTYDRHPTMIVRAAGQGDVARTVAFAAETGHAAGRPRAAGTASRATARSTAASSST